MKIEEFERAVEEDDFAVGDSFWIGDWEFEVVSRRNGDTLVCRDETVFKWELTRDEFVQVIRDNHPEIKSPEEFFDEHEDDILAYFRRGFDVLVGECGVTYGTIMNDAIDEAVKLSKGKSSVGKKQKFPGELLGKQDADEDKGSKSAGEAGSDFYSQQEHSKVVQDCCNLSMQASKSVRNFEHILASKSYDRCTHTYKKTEQYTQQRQLLSGSERNYQPPVWIGFYKHARKRLPRFYRRFRKMSEKVSEKAHYLSRGMKPQAVYEKQQGNSPYRLERALYRSLESYLV